MARRSAQNPRYQKDSKVGSTRKSAASAKPKRDVGESGGSGGKGSSSAKSKPKVTGEPDTPEFKRWRKIWLGLLVAAIVFSLGAWYAKDTQAGTIGLVFAYSTLFSALYIDITKIRRMRKEWVAQGGSAGKSKAEKPAKVEKPANADSTSDADTTAKSEDKKGDA